MITIKNRIQIMEYRGHIRNWKELCIDLQIDTLLPRDKRELEILVEAYQKWGTDMANHLHGSFSFALWDDKKEELFCLRDQFGTKPFYYYLTEDKKLLYSSSIRNIINQPGFVKELNEEMLQIYLSLTYVGGENTFFKGIKKLLPGRYLIYKNGEINIKQYYHLKFEPDNTKTLEQWADEIHSTLGKIMKEVKDENEYAESFLSGGVDSAYILAMSDIKNAESCGYEEAAFDESILAKETATVLGRNCNRFIIKPDDYFDIVPYVMYNMELPLADASAITFALGCIETAKHSKICYSGEGSDEFFGGYNIYQNANKYGDNLKNFYVGNTNIMKEEEKQKILKNYNPHILPINIASDIYKEVDGLDPLSIMTDVDIQLWMEGDIYLNVDKMSSVAGLEIRMPLTDTRIFDIASRIPSKYKVSDIHNKIALRNAAAKVLPDNIAFRKKQGFIVPIRIWLADERYNQDVKAKLNSDIAKKFFHIDKVNEMFEDFIHGNSNNWRKIWTIYTFLVWYEEYFVKR